MSKTHSANDLSYDIKFYCELSAAKDFGEFTQRIQALVNRLGFSDYSYIRIEQACDIDALVMSVPTAIIENYHAEHYWKDDVILQHCLSSTSPIRLSAVGNYLAHTPVRCEVFCRNCELYRMIASFGYYDFYNIPYKAHNGNGNAIFSVTSKDEDPGTFYQKVERSEADLRLLAEAIDYVGTLRFPDLFLGAAESRTIQITPKPLQVLATLANDDLTLVEAADKLGISVNMAQRHIAAARKALGVSTTQGAIYQAMKQNLIEH